MTDSAVTFATDLMERRGRSDAELVERARLGEPSAFEELVRRHQGATRALAYSLAGDWVEAEDLSQEAFLRAFRNLDLLADPGKFGPWLRRVTFGVCIDWVRTFRPQLYRYASSADEAVTLAAPSEEASPLDTLERREMSERVMRALGELTPQQRLMFLLKHREGMTYREIADSFGCSTGAVKKSLFRSLLKLRAALGVGAEADCVSLPAGD